ncbi:hypothetical protein KIH27_15990 [Mycobacterium sp. M1]|uniref:DNA polymerase I n=1 Tax=Mycolicibacter acidiphilus TaxID=2835306 RepID=A0ABS5RNE4_9MYCO|nr:DNA polymerase [Mycolicibacter acidiphilus]MBS9535089.1 hypothetical protein [Mycolicibacter acidiphilus]
MHVKEDRKAPVRSVLYVRKGEDPTPAVEALARSLKPGEFIAFDVETNALWASDPRARLTSIQVGSKYVAVLLDPTDTEHVNAARKTLNDMRFRLTAHNAGFDILYLTRAGVFDTIADGWGRTTDTIILARLLSSGERIGVGLKEQTATWCGEAAVSKDAKEALQAVQKQMGTKGVGSGNWSVYKTVTVNPDGALTGDPEQGNTWALIPRDNKAFVDYCAADVFDSALLAETLDPIVRGLWAERVEAEHRIHRIVCEMSYRGVKFDNNAAVECFADAIARRDKAQADLLALGVDMTYSPPKKSKKLAQAERETDAEDTDEQDSRERLIADAIRAEGVKVPTKTTKDGKRAPTLDKSSLKKYAVEGSKIAPLYREWGRADKEIGTYLTPYLKLRADRIHADIQAGAARTGRMTCSQPNAQNVPASVKACYTADTGFVFLSVDFSSVEMRVAAGMTGDPELVKMYTEPLPASPTERQIRERDPYWQIAWQVWGDTATEKDRKLAKIVVLANMYGGGAEQIASQVDVSVQLAQSVLDGYRKRFPKLGKWFTDNVKPGVEAGEPFWTLPSGRFQSTDPSRAWAGLNLMIQGYARDLLLDAIFRVEDAGMGEFMLLPIHDEILLQVPEGEADAYAERVVKAMETVYNGVPITAEAKVLGTSWMEKTDVKKPAGTSVPEEINNKEK